jgi:hypothetical protein
VKCPLYDPDEYGCVTAITQCDYAHVPYTGPRCSLGWIQFWTPSERAGLKAMGTKWKEHDKSVADGVWIALTEFIKAAREVKESAK